MSFVSVITHNYSVFHKALIFLMRLAWKSRVRLPYLIIIGFMAPLENYKQKTIEHDRNFCNLRMYRIGKWTMSVGEKALDVRLTLEIVIDVENPTPDNGHSGTSSDSEDSDDFHEIPH